MTRQMNYPNWHQPVSIYSPGGIEEIGWFTISQVWDGSVKGHRRLRKACIEGVEELRDKHGLHYTMWSPVLQGGARVPLVDRQHIEVC